MIARVRDWYQKWKEAREARMWPEREIVVELSDNDIIASYPNGDKLVADLNSLQKVKVITNDSGPWGADVWYSFLSLNSRCSFPQGATGEKKATEFLFSMEGLDERTFIEAMGSTSNAEFVVWKKPNEI